MCSRCDYRNNEVLRNAGYGKETPSQEAQEHKARGNWELKRDPLPKETLSKYGFGESLIMEETDKGLLLMSEKRGKLSLKEAAREMAKEREDWSDFDVALADGLESGR